MHSIYKQLSLTQNEELNFQSGKCAENPRKVPKRDSCEHWLFIRLYGNLELRSKSGGNIIPEECNIHKLLDQGSTLSVNNLVTHRISRPKTLHDTVHLVPTMDPDVQYRLQTVDVLQLNHSTPDA